MPKSEVFFVTPELQKVLDSWPADEPRSRLDPFRPFILRWRRQGRSYRKIQEILASQCKVRVHHETLRRFIRRRSRPRTIRPEVGVELAPIPTSQSASETLPVAAKPRMSIEERRAQAEKLRADFKPLFTPKEETKPFFDYDPDKPLTNKPPKEK